MPRVFASIDAPSRLAVPLIKTRHTAESLARALARQQRFVDRHDRRVSPLAEVDAADWNPRGQPVLSPRDTASSSSSVRPEKLRMAKASLKRTA